MTAVSTVHTNVQCTVAFHKAWFCISLYNSYFLDSFYNSYVSTVWYWCHSPVPPSSAREEARWTRNILTG